MNIRRIFVIASREYLAVVRSKAFLISLVILPVIMFGSVFLQRMTSKVKDLHEQWFAVVDRTPGQEMFRTLQADVESRNAQVFVDGRQTEPHFRLQQVTPAEPGPATDAQRVELSRQVRDGSLAAFIEIGGDILTPATQLASDSTMVRYQAGSPMLYAFRQLVTQSVNRAVQSKRLTAAGVKPEVFAAVSTPVPVVDKGLARVGEDGRITYAEPSAQIVSFMVPFGLAMLMFMVLIIGAVPLLQGVVEEKQQRIAEVLLGSVRPFDLMAGKVIGLVGTSMTLIVLYFIAGGWGLWRAGLLEYIPMRVLPWFLVFQFLAVLMYGSLYIAVGSSVNEPKELQSLMLPLNLVMMLPILLLGNILQNPNGPLARAGMWFPLSSPIVTMVRMAIPPGLPTGECLGAAAVVLVAAVFFVYAAGRVFRVGILMQGKAPKLSDLIRWAIRG